MERQSRSLAGASVTVIVVNWNGGAFLCDCLAHLARQTVRPERVLIVDNASTDGSGRAALKTDVLRDMAFRQFRINLGFAAANNRALAECTTDFVALLNPDAYPEPNWLAHLLAAAEAHPAVAAFGSRQLRFGDCRLIDGSGDAYHVSGFAWRRGHGEPVAGAGGVVGDDAEAEVFSPCACAALYRRRALQLVGGFDEDFFCYFEDVDLGFRLRLAGMRSRYVPEAVVRHIGAACSGGAHSEFSVYHGHRNLVWTFVKNMPGALFWCLLPAHLAFNLFSVLHFSLRGQGRVILRAKWDALRGLPRMWRKRRRVQGMRRATVGEIWRLLDKRLLPPPHHVPKVLRWMR